MRYRLSVRCNKNAATQIKPRPKTNGPTRRSQLVFWRIRPRFSGVTICLTDSTLFAPQRERRTTTDEPGSSFAASTSVLTLGTIDGNAPLRMARTPARPAATEGFRCDSPEILRDSRNDVEHPRRPWPEPPFRLGSGDRAYRDAQAGRDCASGNRFAAAAGRGRD